MTDTSAELDAVVEMVRNLGINDPDTTVLSRRVLLDLDTSVPEGFGLAVVDADGVKCEWIVAPGAATDRAVVHLHGGAYTTGGLGSHRTIAAHISTAAGCGVLLVDYRLAPEHQFPAAIDDATSAYRWITGAGMGLDPSKVVISGDSAGGGMVAALLVHLRDLGAQLPAGGVLISAWTDLTLSGSTYDSEADNDPMVSKQMLEESAEAYVPAGIDRTDPRVSPLFAELAGLPPLLIHVGEAEVLRDDSVVFAERAAAAGVDTELYVAPHMIHVWHAFVGMLPESSRDLDAVAAWIRRHQAA